MADVVHLTDYYYVEMRDRSGEAARALRALKDAGVNLAALHAFPSGRRAQVDFVPSDPAAFKAAAKAAKWKLTGPKKAFMIEGEDRTGALADYFAKLAGAGINVTAVSASGAGAGRFGAIFWEKPRDVKKPGRVLGAA